MPAKSEKQRRYLHKHHPKLAMEWEHKYGPGKRTKHRTKRKKK